MAGRTNSNKKQIIGHESGAYTIDLENFSKHLKEFYNHWRYYKTDLWGLPDAITIATPPTCENLRYQKSSAFNIWLLGYEFPETIMVFMDEQIYFLCNQQKAKLLETLKESAKEAVGADLVIHVKANNDDGSTLMEETIRAVHAQATSDSPAIGYIAQEVPEGRLTETWLEKLAGSALEINDVTNGFSDLFAVKDATELACVRKAAYLSCCVIRHCVVPKLKNIIVEKIRVPHSALMDEAKRSIFLPTKIKFKLKEGDVVDICYPPILQSGGKFDLRPGASSNDDDLYYDPTAVIICSIGSRYKSYCSNVARTFLVDPTATQIKAYKVLLKAHDSAIAALRPGRKSSEAYWAAVAVVKSEAPELLPHLSKSAGAGIGLEFHESWVSLNWNSDQTIQKGMVFNVSLGFHNLHAETNNEKTENFPLWLADTVIVTEDPPEVLTSICSKAYRAVVYSYRKGGRRKSQG